VRTRTIAMLLVGLALCSVQATARSSQRQYSADGLYNLANSYARAGKPGLAVLNYERAALLAPNDADIKANLEYVRAGAGVPPEPRSRFSRIAEAAGRTAVELITHPRRPSEIITPASVENALRPSGISSFFRVKAPSIVTPS